MLVKSQTTVQGLFCNIHIRMSASDKEQGYLMGMLEHTHIWMAFGMEIYNEMAAAQRRVVQSLSSKIGVVHTHNIGPVDQELISIPPT